MLQTSESETEILLGNKQLFGIFIVIAVLVGVAFTGGYFVGRSSGTAKAAVSASSPATLADNASANSSGTSNSAAETRIIAPDSSSSNASNDSAASSTQNADMPPASSTVDDEAAARPAPDHPLGSPKRVTAKRVEPEAAAAATTPFAPQTGQSFLQVAAVKRDEAEAVADVLHKKGFRAHAVAKPGNGAIYRVLIGPVKDAGDLSATRDLLRKTGFREVIVQKY